MFLYVPVTVVDHVGDHALARHGNHGLKGAPTVTINGSNAGLLDGAHAVTVLDSNHYALPLGDPTSAVQNVTSQVTRQPLVITGLAPPLQGTPRAGVTLSGTGNAVLDAHHQLDEILSRTQYTLAITTGAPVGPIAAMADTGMGAGPVAVTLDDDGTNCTITDVAGHDLGAGTVTITQGNAGAHNYDGQYPVVGVIDGSRYTIATTSGTAQKRAVKADGKSATLKDDGVGTCTIKHSNPHERVLILDPADAASAACPLTACDFTNLTRP